MGKRKIGVVVVCYNEGKIIAPTLNVYIGYDSISHIIVVDNGSTDDTPRYFNEIKSEKVEIIYTGVDNGYARGNNIGLEYLYKELHCEYAVITQPDVFFEENVIITLAKKIDENKNYAILTSSRIDPMDKAPQLQYVTRRPETFWLQFVTYFAFLRRKCFLNKYGAYTFDKSNDSIIDIAESPGAFFMIQLNVFDKIGGYFDPGTFLYNEESMLAIRVTRVGMKIGYLSNVIYEHRHTQHSVTKNGVSMKVIKWGLESKKYFQDHYLHFNPLQKFILHLAERMSIIERFFISKLRK